MISKAEFDAVYDEVMKAVQEYYKGPVMKKKADVIKFFKERGLDKYLAFPKSCIVPWNSPDNNIILVGHDRTGFYPEV